MEWITSMHSPSQFNLSESRVNTLTGQHLPNQRGLLTKEEVAQWLNVSTRTVNNLMSDGLLVPVRLRSVLRFSPDSVEDLIIASRDTRLEQVKPLY